MNARKPHSSNHTVLEGPEAPESQSEGISISIHAPRRRTRRKGSYSAVEMSKLSSPASRDRDHPSDPVTRTRPPA